MPDRNPTRVIAIRNQVELLLTEVLGEGWEDHPDFADTHKRFADVLVHFTQATDEDDLRSVLMPPDDLFRTFPTLHNELTVVRGITAAALCPHHLLPVHYSVSVAYVPNGFVLGLSKLPRIVQCIAYHPMTQEDFTTRLADLFFDYEGWGEDAETPEGVCERNPQGSLVRVTGLHDCMTLRGARSAATFTTQAIRGIFDTDAQLRAEALTQLQ